MGRCLASGFVPLLFYATDGDNPLSPIATIKMDYLIGCKTWVISFSTIYQSVASWEHSFWGGQRLEFSDNETIFPTKTLPFPDLIFMTQYDRELKTNDEKNLID